MLVLNLACGHGHSFEGWFGSATDFEAQLARGLVTCPICADSAIERRPTAPHLNVSHLRGERKSQPAETEPVVQGQSTAPAPVAAPSAEITPSAMHKALQELVQQVLARTEDVGERFPEEARRIHYGEAAERGIRGKASAAECEALVEEGIAVMALPASSARKGTLQ
jgi:hypothetical protein